MTGPKRKDEEMVIERERERERDVNHASFRKRARRKMSHQLMVRHNFMGLVLPWSSSARGTILG